MSARTGGLVTLGYDWESGFISGATSFTGKAFGRGQKVTNVNVRENPEIIYELGYRQANAVAYKQFEGSMGIEWIMSNPWFFKSLMGVAASSAVSGGVYTHTYTKTSGIIPSMEIDVAFAASSGAITRKCMGAVVDSITLTGAINDVIRVKANIPYFREPAPTMAYGSPIVDTFAPTTFANASLVVNGNVIAEVQSFEITINNNVQPIFGLGSIYAQGAVPTQFDSVGRLSVTMKDAYFINLLRTEISGNSQLIVSNGLTSNSLVNVTVNMTGLNFGEHTVSYQPNQIVIENLPITIKDITSVTAQNSTSSTP